MCKCFADLIIKKVTTNLMFPTQITKLSWDGIGGMVTIKVMAGEYIGNGKILTPELSSTTLTELEKLEVKK